MSMEELFRLARTDDGRADGRARRLRQAARRRHSGVGARAAVPAAPGLRLGRGRVPTSSSAAPIRSSTCCSRATSSAPTASPEQVALTMPILPGTDGVRRMSKSLGNYIGVTEPPTEIYGKTMSIPDAALEHRGTSCCSAHAPDPALGPRDAKRALARALVERFHGAGCGRRGGAGVRPRPRLTRACPRRCPPSNGRGRRRRRPPSGAARRGVRVSTSEARRTLAQGGVRIDGAVVDGGDARPRRRRRRRPRAPARQAPLRARDDRAGSDRRRDRWPSTAACCGWTRPATGTSST